MYKNDDNAAVLILTFAAMSTTLRHILFWTVVYILWTYMKSSRVLFSTYLVVNIVNMAIYIAAFYFLKHFQIPKLFSQGKILMFATSLLASSFVLYFIWRVNGEIWIDAMRRVKYPFFMSPIDYMTQAVQFYSPAMALLAWDSFYERKEEQERIRMLEKEKLETELKYLKAQLNPHFLFNTLNNLYSFVLNGSPKAPDMIMRLSGILDYVLYKSQTEMIAIVEEVKAIEDFMELEKIRYGNRLQVTYTKKIDHQVEISPLLALSIVENAFKHGASGDIDSPRIKIKIEAGKNQIIMDVWNTKSSLEGEITDAYKEGIGLSNIKRQLKLIYPGRHQISVKEDEGSFQIIVKIEHSNE